jgi:hypothetical protein
MGIVEQRASQHRQHSPRQCQFYVADESTLDASALQSANEEHAVAACSEFYWTIEPGASVRYLAPFLLTQQRD